MINKIKLSTSLKFVDYELDPLDFTFGQFTNFLPQLLHLVFCILACPQLR